MLTLILSLFSIAWGTVPKTPAQLFSTDQLWMVHVYNAPGHWVSDRIIDDFQSSFGAMLSVKAIPFDAPTHCPNQGEEALSTYDFRLRTSGNYTRGTAKASYKIRLGPSVHFLGLNTLNLKSMWNDPSMMREALTWELMQKANIPASRMGYARVCINDRYMGLYALIEEVGPAFVKERLGDQVLKGTLYKANHANNDVGPANLAPLPQYFREADPDNRTYSPKMNPHSDYADIRALVDGLHAPGATEATLSSVLDTREVLRWAAVNMLLGSWDNYWNTASNYYLFNRQPQGQTPFFSFIPWDYDNSFGTSYDGTAWEHQGILSWEAHGRRRPLVGKLLAVPQLRDYYLKYMRSFMNEQFNAATIERRALRLFDKIKTSAYLESDGQYQGPHTGRRFTNDQFYRQAHDFEQVNQDGLQAYGLKHFTIMRQGFVDNELKALGY